MGDSTLKCTTFFCTTWVQMWVNESEEWKMGTMQLQKWRQWRLKDEDSGDLKWGQWRLENGDSEKSRVWHLLRSIPCRSKNKLQLATASFSDFDWVSSLSASNLCRLSFVTLVISGHWISIGCGSWAAEPNKRSRSKKLWTRSLARSRFSCDSIGQKTLWINHGTSIY